MWKINLKIFHKKKKIPKPPKSVRILIKESKIIFRTENRKLKLLECALSVCAINFPRQEKFLGKIRLKNLLSSRTMGNNARDL